MLLNIKSIEGIQGLCDRQARNLHGADKRRLDGAVQSDCLVGWLFLVVEYVDLHHVAGGEWKLQDPPSVPPRQQRRRSKQPKRELRRALPLRRVKA